MPSAYTLLLRRETVDVLRSLHGFERQQFERFFDALQDRPGQPADAYTRDEVRRRLEIKYVAPFLPGGLLD